MCLCVFFLFLVLSVFKSHVKGLQILFVLCLIPPLPFFCLLRSVELTVYLLYLMFSPFFNVNIFVLYFWKATSTECMQNHMCLTCKSTVMVVTNHSSICKVANTKSLHFEYVAHILLFAIFFILDLSLARIFYTNLHTKA